MRIANFSLAPLSAAAIGFGNHQYEDSTATCSRSLYRETKHCQFDPRGKVAIAGLPAGIDLSGDKAASTTRAMFALHGWTFGAVGAAGKPVVYMAARLGRGVILDDLASAAELLATLEGDRRIKPELPYVAAPWLVAPKFVACFALADYETPADALKAIGQSDEAAARSAALITADSFAVVVGVRLAAAPPIDAMPTFAPNDAGPDLAVVSRLDDGRGLLSLALLSTATADEAVVDAKLIELRDAHPGLIWSAVRRTRINACVQVGAAQ